MNRRSSKDEASFSENVELMNSADCLEEAIEKAEKWVNLCEVITDHVEQKVALELEYGNTLKKLSSEIYQKIIDNDQFPLRYIWLASSEEDKHAANRRLNFDHKRLEEFLLTPLNDQMKVHRTMCTQMRQQHHAQNSKKQETIKALNKAKKQYIDMNVEKEKLESKRKKMIKDNFVQKLDKVTRNYRACIEAANEEVKRSADLKNHLTSQLCELMAKSEDVMKTMTKEFFNSYFKIMEPLHNKLPVFMENCDAHTAGETFSNELKKLCQTSDSCFLPGAKTEEFVFEEHREDDCTSYQSLLRTKSNRKKSLTGVLNGMKSLKRFSVSSQVQSDQKENEFKKIRGSSRKKTKKTQAMKDASRSVESMDKIDHLEVIKESNHSVSLPELISSSGIAKENEGTERHAFKSLRVAQICFRCKNYVCFNGVSCTKCQLSFHMKCLPNSLSECIPTLSNNHSPTCNLNENDRKINSIKTCISHIEKNGLSRQGLYRISGNLAKKNALLEKWKTNFPQEFERSLPSLECVHTFASILKSLLIESQGLLFPDSVKEKLFTIFREHLNSEPQSNELLESVKRCAEEIPPANAGLLFILFRHLNKVTSQCEANLMTVENLAEVLGPTIFHSSSSNTNLAESITTNSIQNKIINYFISYYEIILKCNRVTSTLLEEN